MKIAVLDSTAVVVTGPGSPAYFSRFAIKHLRERGHQVVVAGGFDESLCSQADLVWTEWGNQDAVEAAASGVCKRLVVRIRGFEVHGQLDKLLWQNVDCVVYESAFLRDFVEESFPEVLAARMTTVLPSGIDLSEAPYVKRLEQPGTPVVALVARATSDKGYQLAFEWARQRPDIELHVTTALAERSPRLRIYLDQTCPFNVTIHESVDTLKWLHEIGATHILSASIWETLGYSIVEGMAVGCKPLIHEAPGTTSNWPHEYLWRSFADLNALVDGPFDSESYRALAAGFDAAPLSVAFADVVLDLPARSVPTELQRAYTFRNNVIRAADAIRERLDTDIAPVAALAEDFRRRWPVNDRYAEDRYIVACMLSSAYLIRSDFERAAMWACRAMLDAPWPEAMVLMAEICAEREAYEEARAWMLASITVPDPDRRFTMPVLTSTAIAKLDEYSQKAIPVLQPFKGQLDFVFVVTVRNAEQWIERCLISVGEQVIAANGLGRARCIVLDDVSTDATPDIIRKFVVEHSDFMFVQNTERKYQARNTVEMARLVASTPETIIVLVDGDDWLEHNAVTWIAEAYTRGAWMTYGNYRSSDGARSRFGPYPIRIAQAGAFADWTWQATAPRTFKRFLLDQLIDEDFMIDGEWPKVAGDVCVVLPMLQMACERAVAITTPIYVYNNETPDSDHKQAAGEQVRIRDRLFDRPPKSRLER